MLRSMTGFGAAAGRTDAVEYAIEIRSVNNRYLKTIVRLPENFTSVEADIEALLRSRLGRGTVTVTVRMKLPEEAEAYRVNSVALRSYLNRLRELQADGGESLRIDLASLLLLPGVCVPPEIEEICQKTRADLLKIVQEALEKLLAMRREEGKALAEDLTVSCRLVEENLRRVNHRKPTVLTEYHQRLADRVRELTLAGNVTIDQDSLAREVALFAERSDIAEEVSRLGAHLGQFRQEMDAPEPSGRKLDFIAQEMLREANTIGAKSNDVEIARCVVEIKTGIDRMKEQVQNVE